MSTGIRRAPIGATVTQPRVAPHAAVRLVRPASPTYVMVPVPILQFPMMNMAAPAPISSTGGGRQSAIPTLSPMVLPTLPPFTLPQLPPLPSHPVTFPPGPGGPITLAPMPTMPGLTMPPSFQRLLGMTSTTSAPEMIERREEYHREEKEYTEWVLGGLR